MVDFVEEYDYLKEEIDAAYLRVMESGIYILGSEVSNFEKEFAEKCASKYCIGVGNGLDAIHLSLRSLGVGEGDEVIVPSNTYIATWIGVSLAGAIPVPTEPSEETYNMDPNLIEEKINQKTKAILPVHLYGQPADMGPILEIAEKYDLKVVDDAAQAHGGRYKGKQIGSVADATAFSFYPTKNMGAMGDGGAVTTSDPEIAAKLRMLRNYGESDKYVNDLIGFNSRLDELQAAFLRVRLKHLDEMNERKTKISRRYLKEIENKSVQLPIVASYATPVWHQFVLRTEQRYKLKLFLKENGIETLIHYPIPPYKQLAYKNLGFVFDAFKIANDMANEVLSIPIRWLMDSESVDSVIKIINSWG